ncbi:P-loop containing nucleoside triphosphate hydrolase protein [Martensiomyces pterosporus]|nr:P-loop containing nucleoside triphosphate hydrolase protein [Martensiomyces pterosporus]
MTTSKYFALKRPAAAPSPSNRTAKPATPSDNTYQWKKPKIAYSPHAPSAAASTMTGRVPVSSLPAEFAHAYPFTHFNRLQSECFGDVFGSSRNMVVSAPTASGKTVLMELAIYRLFQHQASRSRFKVLYLAPLRALCAEKALDWKARYSRCGLECIEAAGPDADSLSATPKPAGDALLAGSHIVCSTPEKWVSIARNSDSSTSLLRTFKLVLVDECHMVGTDRGAWLEIAVSSIRMVSKDARVVAVSATVGNIGDIAEWLGVGHGASGLESTCMAKTRVFGEEYRPVPLTKVVLGFDSRMPYYKFQRNLDFRLPGALNSHSCGKPALIFCSTRGSAQDTCRHLIRNKSQLAHQPAPIHLTSLFTNHLLNESVPHGIAYHHSGLSSSDKRRVEQLFASGSIRILCSTSALGTGVNLPAHMVIVKGTKGYVDSNYAEYRASEIWQFIGRAGRPQFGSSGKALILTESSMVSKYRNMVGGCEVLESSLYGELARHIIIEVRKQTFQTVADVYKW